MCTAAAGTDIEGQRETTKCTLGFLLPANHHLEGIHCPPRGDDGILAIASTASKKSDKYALQTHLVSQTTAVQVLASGSKADLVLLLEALSAS